MLSDMDGNLFSLMVMSIHENPLYEIVAVLIASDVYEGYARTVGMSCSNDTKVPVEKLNSTDLEAFLNDLGSKLIDAVVIGIG